MRRIASWVTTAMAAGLAAMAYASSPEDPSLVAPLASGPVDAAAQSAPPTAASSDLATLHDSPAAEPNTRLAAVAPPGMSPREACTDFSNISACAAALHAAQNLSIPFSELKSKVTGGAKLGAAIHDLKPEAHAKAEERKAEEQARSDMRAPQM